MSEQELLRKIMKTNNSTSIAHNDIVNDSGVEKFKIPKRIRELLWTKYNIDYRDILSIKITNGSAEYICNSVDRFKHFRIPEERKGYWSKIEWMVNKKGGGLFLKIWYSEVKSYNPFHFFVMMMGKEIDGATLIYDE